MCDQSQLEAAKFIGISKSNITRWKDGARTAPYGLKLLPVMGHRWSHTQLPQPRHTNAPHPNKAHTGEGHCLRRGRQKPQPQNTLTTSVPGIGARRVLSALAPNKKEYHNAAEKNSREKNHMGCPLP